MQKADFHKFLLGIVLPSLLTIGLFVASIYFFIVPSFEENMMERKKEMIHELTNTAWSLINEYSEDYKNGLISIEEAQELAALRIEKLRYGIDRKDYFWIIDQSPKMIMHPYRPELNGQNLSEYQDPNGKKIFVESVRIVSEHNQGFIDYKWQWKDDSSRIVPKLSYVKGFEDWGWIIGTGIYLEDVKEEITIIKRKLLRITSFIMMVIVITLAYIVRQSLRIERMRNTAEEKLVLSKQKYKSLVEASTEGTLLFISHRVVFANQKIKKMLGCDGSDLENKKFEEIFDITWEDVISKFDDPDKSVSLETRIQYNSHQNKEVIVSVSRIKLDNSNGFIVIVKDVTRNKILELESGNLNYELQASLLLMNQSVKNYIREIYACELSAPIKEAAEIMERKNQNIVFVKSNDSIIGSITISDISKRAVAKGMPLSNPVSTIMSSPIVSVNQDALLYEVVITCNNMNISHVAIIDNQAVFSGYIALNDILNMQYNSTRLIIQEIEKSETVDELKKLHHRLPVIVNALVESGDKAIIVTRVITSITDAVTHRLIELVIEKLGKPPCEFAFIVLGSEGRMEQTLKTDQDNAIIYEDLVEEKEKLAKEYFQKMGTHISDALHKIGLPYCDGNIMGKNPQWVQPLSKWKKYFDDWINTSSPQDILDSCIFFDFRNVYGNISITDELRTWINGITKNKEVFLYHHAQSVIKYKPPLGTFGNIVADNEGNELKSIDLKKILLPVTSFVRIYTLQHNLSETNTLARINDLYKHNIITKSIYENLMLSYNFLMVLRFKGQVKKYFSNTPPDNYILIDDLTDIEKTMLKKILSELSLFQSKLNFDFKGNI